MSEGTGRAMSENDGRGENIPCPGSSSPFCLGMTEYNCCGVPEPKRKKLSLQKKKA